MRTAVPEHRPPTGPSAFHAGVLLALLASGCTNDKTIGVRHEAPAVTITSPSEGSSFYQGQSIHFEALAQVFDSTALTDLNHSWVTGTQTMCTTASVNADGTAGCDWSFANIGEQTVTVTVQDPTLDTASATVTVTILENTPPSITLESPQNGDFFEPGELIVFEATVDDAEDTPENLVVTVTSSIDGDLGLITPPSSSGDWTAAGNLSNGDHLITVRVTDSAGRSDQDTATVSVNARPGAPSVSITPDPTESGQELSAIITADAVDPEGDAVTYRYDWFQGGTLYQSGSNDTISRGVTVRGQYWEVYAYPNDGFGYGDPGYDSITIENSVPAADSVDINPSTPYTGDLLTAVASGWFDQDSDPERYHYVWSRNGTVDTGETTATFPAAKTVKHDLLQVSATPYDAYGSGATLSSASVEVRNTTPTAPVVAISPDAPQPENNLSCSVTTPSTDADGDAISYTYAWYQNGTLTSITTNTVASSYTAHGDGWECVVTPNDGEANGATGTDYVTVNDGTAPAAPVINALNAYRNDASVSLSGTCEADCTMTYYCSDATTTWTDTNTCGSGGTFSYTTSLTRGDVNSCYATCTDLAGNTSPNSNTVNTEVCDPWDQYEDAAGYGDSGPDAIDEWPALSDVGTDTVDIVANVLNTDTVDWYRVSASDDVSSDLSAGVDYFKLNVEMLAGSSDYEFYVYDNTYDSTALECTTASSQYSWYNQDVGDGSHTMPSDTRSCGSSSALYNNCADDSRDFYIKVVRKASVSESCQHYELEITNGVW